MSNGDINATFRRRDLADVVKVTTDVELAGKAAKDLADDNFKQIVAMVHDVAEWNPLAGKYAFPNKAEEFFSAYAEMEVVRVRDVYFGGRDRKTLTREQKSQFNKRLNPFTSNKSVVLTAVREGVYMLDDNGFPLGKSNLTRQSGEAKSPLIKFGGAIKLAADISGKLPDSDVHSALVSAEALVSALKNRYESITENG